MRRSHWLSIALQLCLAACAARLESTPPVPEPAALTPPIFTQIGEASWYGREFAGKPTSNGTPYNPNKMVAAHRTLPLGTVVRVTNLENGKMVKVTIADRGPYIGHRIIDLSERAAKELAMKDDGTCEVRLVVEPADQPPTRPDTT